MNKKLLKISSVTYLNDYVLRITFENNDTREIDFFNFLNSSTNSQIKAYLNIDKFKNYRLENGELMWGDYDLLFPIHDLYNKKIS